MKHISRIPVFLACVMLAPNVLGAFNFPDFCDVSELTLNGVTSSLTPNEGCTLLLTNDLGQSGSAFVTNSVPLSGDASFSTAFRFQFTNPRNGGADGLVFVVQTLANDVGGGGGGIGYQGITNSVGVEFDNWFNSGSDPDANHVGIDLNGNVNSVVTASVSPEFDQGDPWYAWVDYDGVTDLLEVRLSQTSTRPAVPILLHTVDLVTVLGQTDAFVGFTSGTGGAAAEHQVLNWQFRESYAPIGGEPRAAIAVPTLGGFALSLVAGLLLLIGLGRLFREH